MTNTETEERVPCPMCDSIKVLHIAVCPMCQSAKSIGKLRHTIALQEKASKTGVFDKDKHILVSLSTSKNIYYSSFLAEYVLYTGNTQFYTGNGGELQTLVFAKNKNYEFPWRSLSIKSFDFFNVKRDKEFYAYVVRVANIENSSVSLEHKGIKSGCEQTSKIAFVGRTTDTIEIRNLRENKNLQEHLVELTGQVVQQDRATVKSTGTPFTWLSVPILNRLGLHPVGSLCVFTYKDGSKEHCDDLFGVNSFVGFNPLVLAIKAKTKWTTQLPDIFDTAQSNVSKPDSTPYKSYYSIDDDDFSYGEHYYPVKNNNYGYGYHNNQSSYEVKNKACSFFSKGFITSSEDEPVFEWQND